MMTAEQRLAEVFVELADTLVDDFDVVDFLTMLTERCVEILDATAAGLMLTDQHGTLQLAASTNDQTRLLELFELQADEGPCPECFATGQALTNIGPDEAARRWPRFAAASQGTGYITAHALPLRLRGQVVGALNLFTSGDLTTADIAVGQAMADIATIGLLQERAVREQTTLSEQLQTALHSRIAIEQAKGVLAAKTGLDVGAAFTSMRRYARHRGLPLSEVAADVITGDLSAHTVTGQAQASRATTGTPVR